MQNFFDHFETLRKQGRPVALATVFAIEGGSSKRLGARMWVSEGGSMFGSLTVGGCVDGRARDEAHYVLQDGVARRVWIDLNEDGLDFGMSCAGTVGVHIARIERNSAAVDALDAVRNAVDQGRTAVLATPLDAATSPFAITEEIPAVPPVHDLLDADEAGCRFAPGSSGDPDVLYQSFVPPRLLVVVGAAPIAAPLVRIGKMLGFRVVMVDGKEERLAGDRFAEADERISGIPSEICARFDLDHRSAVVLTAHDYRYEVPVLKEVLLQETGYVGFVASRRRGGAVLDFLARSGVEREALRRVHVPVGLDIGALTPAEIAVSIISEIIVLRSGATCRPLVELSDAPERRTAESVLSE